MLGEFWVIQRNQVAWTLAPPSPRAPLLAICAPTHLLPRFCLLLHFFSLNSLYFSLNYLVPLWNDIVYQGAFHVLTLIFLQNTVINILTVDLFPYLLSVHLIDNSVVDAYFILRIYSSCLLEYVIYKSADILINLTPLRLFSLPTTTIHLIFFILLLNQLSLFHYILGFFS